MSRTVHQKNRKRATKAQNSPSKGVFAEICFEPACPDYGVTSWAAGGKKTHRRFTLIEEAANRRQNAGYGDQLPEGFLPRTFGGAF